MTSLWVSGVPAPKGSRIAGRRKDGGTFTRPASKKEKAWMEAVTEAAQDKAVHLEPPYRVAVHFYMPSPKKPTYAWPSRGDIDKLVRCTLDGLTKGELIVDDAHIVEVVSKKAFTKETPGALILVDEVQAT